MDIPHTIMEVCSLIISKPEINRPKLVKLFLSNIFKAIDFYATEQKHRAEGSTPLSCVNCERCDKLGQLQEETNKKDSGCQARQVSRPDRDLKIQETAQWQPTIS